MVPAGAGRSSRKIFSCQGLSGVAVEQRQVSFVGVAGIHVGADLAQGLAYGVLAAAPNQLALDDDPALRAASGGRPEDRQIRASASHAVFALDSPTAVDDALQKRLQQQLRAGLAVLEPLHPMCRVLAEEILKSAHQLIHPQPSVLADVPRSVDRQHRLRGMRELPRHDFPVDGVGDGHGVAPTDEAEVAHVLDVVRGNVLDASIAAQQGFDHPPHTLVLELSSKLIEVGFAAQHQLLHGVANGLLGDVPAAVAARLAVEARLVRERVHQPRLAAGSAPDFVQRLLVEPLSGGFGVLAQQGVRLGLREIAEAQRAGVHVECAAAEYHCVLGAGPDPIVAHIADAAQHDAVGIAARPFRVAGAQLAEYGDQGVADQRVDLVDEQHQRLLFGLRPAGQRLLQRPVRPAGVERIWPDATQMRAVQHGFFLLRQRAQNRPHGGAHILSRRLADLDVDVHATVAPAAIEPPHQR